MRTFLKNTLWLFVLFMVPVLFQWNKPTYSSGHILVIGNLFVTSILLGLLWTYYFTKYLPGFRKKMEQDLVNTFNANETGDSNYTFQLGNFEILMKINPKPYSPRMPGFGDTVSFFISKDKIRKPAFHRFFEFSPCAINGVKYYKITEVPVGAAKITYFRLNEFFAGNKKSVES
ncbi:MAG: hypothetical protein GC181_07675 [Bacteroidetes bacterium]|nr:hypothetical protein [Bacteroidota bacterium]